VDVLEVLKRWILIKEASPRRLPGSQAALACFFWLQRAHRRPLLPVPDQLHCGCQPHCWVWPKILGRSLSPGFSGQAIEFLHILRIGIVPALLSERGKKLFG
jgi:hypothetical protein